MLRSLAYVTLPLLAACYAKPAEPSSMSMSDGGMNGIDGAKNPVDADPGTDASSLCTAITDTFDAPGVQPCGAWGVPTNGPIVRAGGQLSVAPPPNDINESYCRTMQMRLEGTIMLQLANVPDTTDGDYQLVDVAGPTAQDAFFQIYRSGGVRRVSLTCPSANSALTTFSPTTDAWVKFAFSPQGTDLQVTVTTSPMAMGGTTRMIGSCTFTGALPLLGTLRFGAGTEASRPSPSATLFDNFSTTCP